MMPPGYMGPGHDRDEGISPGVPGDGPQGQEGQHHGDQGDDGDGNRHQTRSRGKAIEWTAYDAKAVDDEDDDDDDEETEEVYINKAQSRIGTYPVFVS